MEVIFYKLQGCKACEAAKPVFDKAKEEYKEFSFTEANLPTDRMELFEEHADKEPAVEYLKDDNGEVLRNHAGRPFSKIVKDEDGNTVMAPVLAAPAFYFINPEDNEFLGKTSNPMELESLLEQMRGLLNEQD